MILVIDGVLRKTEHIRNLFSESDKFGPLDYDFCPNVPNVRNWVQQEIIETIRKTHGGKEPTVKASYLRSDTAAYDPEQVCHTHQKTSEWTSITFLNEDSKRLRTAGNLLFWRHNQTGLREYYHEKYAPEVWEQLQKDTFDEEKWVTDTLITPHPGRTVVFRNSRFWSFWPNPGWGPGVPDGRKTLIVHYDASR